MLAWGINDFGQLGSGSTFYETQPKQVVGLEDVRIADINAGGWHSLALTTEGGAPPRGPWDADLTWFQSPSCAQERP